FSAGVQAIAVGDGFIRGCLSNEEGVAATVDGAVRVIEAAPVNDVAPVIQAGLERRGHLAAVGRELDFAGLDLIAVGIEDVDECLFSAAEVRRKPSGDFFGSGRLDGAGSRVEPDRV